MARVKANIPFAGVVTMSASEIRDIPDDKVVRSLVASGYVTELASEQKKRVKKDEN